MPTAMVTFNGRITLPAQVRKQLGLKTGDKVDFLEVEKGRFAICCETGSATDMECHISGLDHAPAIEEMEKVTL
jgi:AbrB family looped-hinge helix DNA binding protein